jgi:hypothetical protein
VAAAAAAADAAAQEHGRSVTGGKQRAGRHAVSRDYRDNGGTTNRGYFGYRRASNYSACVLQAISPKCIVKLILQLSTS